ncbi:septation protein SepH [soil metagenome]
MKEQDLTLVGLTEDKQRLVLVSDAGEEFTLPADARLRAALRGEHARLGQLEITMESALRPRDIQARIRAGESPEAVAAAAQTSLEKIMGYATPVLAERAHIADRAQRASVRRKATDGPARILGDAVAERLRTRNVDPSTVEWDAWRRDDGRWTLVADYRSGESARHAEFVFDAPGRYVVAEDDEARWLIGEQSTSKGPQPRTSTRPRRLASVDSHGDDVELPLGDDAIDLVSAEGPELAEPTEDLTATAAAIRETGDADWIATQATERPAAPMTEEPVSEPEATSEEAGGAEASDAEASGEEAEAQPDTGRRSAKKKSRASVPSWDEIMFGGGKRE